MAKKFFIRLFFILVYVFAAIGFFLTAGYFAVRFGLTNEEGIIDAQREAFFGTSTLLGQAASVGNAGNNASSAAASGSVTPTAPAFSGPWAESEEWKVMETAIRKDQATLTRAAHDSGVPARLILANLVAEQLRLFFTDRENYKKFFYPLKILGPQSQFSWGVMGMKEATAIQVEENIKNPASPYYLGAAYEHLLDFPAGTTNLSRARFTRMTDQHDHYWSYLYAGLYIRQIEAQWKNAGYPIDNNVGVLSTLYNIGFLHSLPKPNPQTGGAAITLSDGTLSYGSIANDFYKSSLLTDIFPR